MLQLLRQSPELNSIENLCKTFKFWVHARDPKNIKELKNFCKEECLKPPASPCKKIISSYGKGFGGCKVKHKVCN